MPVYCCGEPVVPLYSAGTCMFCNNEYRIYSVLPQNQGVCIIVEERDVPDAEMAAEEQII